MSDKLNTGETLKVFWFTIALAIGFIAFVWVIYAQIIAPAISDVQHQFENPTISTQGPN